MTKNERLALKHQMFLEKQFSHAILQEKGLLTLDPVILELCANGYDAFELAVANKIMTEQADKVFLNKCPKCQKLARTPFAKQCRHCDHHWRDSEAK